MDFIPEFNDKQLDRLSEFLSNTSLLSLASLVFPNLFRIDKPNMLDLTLGLGMTAGFLLASLILIRKIYD
ncbi:hypothetical protein A3I48_00020 [Candidatus Daviesbacteria bacterium RIFCSPLOWO2_02_FULL_36_7]|uniref:Uncharacterized protein n=1 Tax=Candidatus Daviesbacteria bacterium RIFCSPLOWO2_02_FULL_36_7 TaxID=1797792 RepID=A0A1F5MHD7_9BACT|nr:MAG: hypothetical protein A3I48_00020 [Candidatus Daviesbacteria bacterium RIFCSPLOWO2_02_FULL_36_7]